MVLKEVIAYYSTHGSLYCTMLDARKAFDRVDNCRLFRELLDKDLPRDYLRLMLNMYTNYVTRVSWNGICSTLLWTHAQRASMLYFADVFLYIFLYWAP